MPKDFMPRETLRSEAGAPGYLAEHSPAMLELLDLSAQPTAFAGNIRRRVALDAYRVACSYLMERTLDDRPLSGPVKYWTNVRDGLIKKYQFTESEINNA